MVRPALQSVPLHAPGGRGPAALLILSHVLREPRPQLAYYTDGRSTFDGACMHVGNVQPHASSRVRHEQRRRQS